MYKNYVCIRGNLQSLYISQIIRLMQVAIGGIVFFPKIKENNLRILHEHNINFT